MGSRGRIKQVSKHREASKVILWWIGKDNDVINTYEEKDQLDKRVISVNCGLTRIIKNTEMQNWREGISESAPLPQSIAIDLVHSNRKTQDTNWRS